MPHENLPELKALLVDEMEDLLHAENQLIKALPKMAKAAHAPQLRQAFDDHLEKTRGHVERLRQGFEQLNVKAKAQTCKGMEGLIEEGEETMDEGKDRDAATADLALIIAAQKIEHYEISSYGSLRTLADRIGEMQVARLLADTEADEREADELLTDVAQPLFAKAA
ncbi:MAG TPA: ferritin-like domain-containing protein [Terriglobales bacterium]|jgi:Mn-containing catalase